MTLKLCLRILKRLNQCKFNGQYKSYIRPRGTIVFWKIPLNKQMERQTDHYHKIMTPLQQICNKSHTWYLDLFLPIALKAVSVIRNASLKKIIKVL